MNPILGIDFGQARIGLAISDELRWLAHPLETIPANKNSAKRIAEIVRDRKIDKVVIGIPRHMSGAIGESAKKALDFAADLRQKLQDAQHKLRTTAVEELDELLRGHNMERRDQAAGWAQTGRREAARLRWSLVRHRESLDSFLEMLTPYVYLRDHCFS